MRRTVLIVCFLAHCGTDPTNNVPVDSGVDMGVSDLDSSADISRPRDDGRAVDMDEVTDVRTDAGGDMTPLPLEPTEYCEETVEMFCDYYLRCSRISATDAADCRRNFLETCNAAFEPQYVALAELGKLQLSREGIAVCGDHLSTVACERQIFDLDGPCAGVWPGQTEVDGPCAPGIGSFVCGAGSTCVLDTSFCGACEAAGAIGEACIDNRCATGATCINDVCEARGLPGDACDDEHPCAVGSGCVDAVCQPLTIVGLGDACGAAARCPYQTTCLGGMCVQDALLGEPCADANCASGWCDSNICRAFVTPGDPCGENFQCLSRRCEAGKCSEPVSTCFEP